jgi:hypothetical protein
MTVNWSDFETGGLTGDFVKFTNRGDSVEGVIVSAQAYTFPGTDKPVPQLQLRCADNSTKVVTVSQADAKRQLVTLAPKVGDTIKITYVDDYRMSNGYSGKKFTVDVTKGEARPLI